jgi:hypothetical protein
MKIESPSENFIKIFDSPWLQNQVKTHLFFGEIKGKYIYLAAIVAYVSMCIMFLVPQERNDIFSVFIEPRVVAFSVALILAIIFGNYKTNALLWAAIKFTVLFSSFICILCGSINLLRDDPADAELIIIGLFWFPGLEFVKNFTEKQKYITLARILITVPILLKLH